MIQNNSVENSQRHLERSHFIRNINKLIVKHWQLYVLSFLLFVTVGYIYLRYATPKYRVSATILVQDDQKGSDIPNSDLLEEFGLGGKSNVDNEVEILRSRSLMEKVVYETQLYIEYHKEGRVIETELFQDLGFQLRAIKYNLDSLIGINTYSIVKKTDSTFSINFGNYEQINRYGDTIYLNEGEFVIEQDSQFNKNNFETVQLKFRKPADVVAQLMSDLSVIIPNRQVTIIQLSLATVNTKKGEFVLNRLIDTYLRSNVENKNRIADSTMRFIDERVKNLGTELSDIEKDIQVFKEDNKLTNLSVQSESLIQNITSSLQQITQYQVQLQVVETLEAYLKDNSNKTRIVPVSLVVQDPGFIEQLTAYNQLQLEREKSLVGLTEQNPVIISIDQRLSQLRSNMTNSLQTIKSGLKAAIREFQKQSAFFDVQAKSIPEKERIYLDKTRMQNVKQQLFLFLLQKREETAVSKSSTLANARIIDPAFANKSPFEPKRSFVLLFCAVLGLLIPYAVLYSYSILDNKVRSREDIKSILSIPIIGELSKFEGGELLPTMKQTRSLLSEQFRMLRANMQYVLNGLDKPVVLFTSSMSNEGKSFASLNLAYTMSLTGKKTLYIELDMRKPSFVSKLNLPRDKGFSNYVIGNFKEDEIIHKSSINDNLWILPSGPMPPNPAELLLTQKTQNILSYVRKNFDFIVIDTPPVGLVSDPLLLAPYVDSIVFMVRQGVTHRIQLRNLSDLMLNHPLPRPSVILNDIDITTLYGYGYGYGYDYGNKYFDLEKKRKNIIQKILNNFYGKR